MKEWSFTSPTCGVTERLQCIVLSLFVMWPGIQKYVAVVHLGKTLRPKNKSFTTVELASKDLPFITKLGICLSIVQLYQEVLTKYQTDAPLISY